jgi:peptidoglycan-associated lipoprotein
MKKLSIYTFLVAAVLFTGCSQKEVEVSKPSDTMTNTNSESMLNKIDDSNIQVEVINDALLESAENGYYYMINGKKEFIENIYFGFDKYNLNASTKVIAKSNAMKLSAIKSGTMIKVEGNTDEWGSDEYNYALGLKRAKVVKDSLQRDGISASVITVVSFGESNPTCSDKNASCWQKNRRTEYKLVK